MGSLVQIWMGLRLIESINVPLSSPHKLLPISSQDRLSINKPDRQYFETKFYIRNKNHKEKQLSRLGTEEKQVESTNQLLSGLGLVMVVAPSLVERQIQEIKKMDALLPTTEVGLEWKDGKQRFFPEKMGFMTNM